MAIEIYGMFDEEIYNPIHEKEESKNIWPKSKQRRGEKYDFWKKRYFLAWLFNFVYYQIAYAAT